MSKKGDQQFNTLIRALETINDTILLTVLERPSHPYMMALPASVPSLNPDSKRSEATIKGEVTSNVCIPSGCRFHPRCPYAQQICKEKEPFLRDFGTGHFVSCHLAESLQ